MKDYQEIPGGKQRYSAYLIRKPEFLTKPILETILDLTKGKLLSLERLYKGTSSALVIFGPKILETRFGDLLSLLELEDYTKVSAELRAWEVTKMERSQLNNIFDGLPQLSSDQQFWWQVVLNGGSGQIRAVFVAPGVEPNILAVLEGIGQGALKKVPRPFTSSQILEFYRSRIFEPASAFALTAEEVLTLIGLLHR